MPIPFRNINLRRVNLNLSKGNKYESGLQFFKRKTFYRNNPYKTKGSLLLFETFSCR
jgi:hypothetical protein